jgi:hypothetical protein
MEHKLIKTDNYLLVVSDEKIKEGELYYLESVTTNNMILKASESKSSTNCKKIIAHLPLNNSPYLDGVDVLPSLGDDVDKDLFYNKQVMNPYSTETQSYSSYEKGFIEGYNKSKEKYKYTEEDIAKAVMFGRWGATDKIAYNNFIQSLNQPTLPIAFECKIDNILSYNADDGIDALVNPNFGEPKTITNSQGLTEWVGEYKF